MLHVSLLGEQGITADGTSLQARSSRAIALVAFLAVHAGAPQPRPRIAGTFWPESTDAQALTNLDPPVHVAAVCGKNASLETELRSAAADLNGRLIVYGYVTIMAELLGGVSGIGYQLRLSQELFRMDRAIAWTVVLVAFVVATNLALALFERSALTWRHDRGTAKA